MAGHAEKHKKIKVMKNSKAIAITTSTQKSISAFIVFAFAIITLCFAYTANANVPVHKKAKFVESEIIAEIDAMLMEEEAIEEVEIELTETLTEVKVFGLNDELLGEGDTSEDQDLRKLVNKAELISEVAGIKYYSIVK